MPEGGPLVGVVYESFPRDGRLRWLRMLDRVDVRGRGTGTPTVAALLSPLDGSDAGSLPPLKMAAKDAVIERYPVHAGSLPALRLGAVFLDGREVGHLPMETDTFCFRAGDARSELTECAAESKADRPDWWKFPWSVVPASRYALRPYHAAHCLSIRSGARELVIPCCEVFRAFCAPESRLATALLSGPWNVVRDRVVNGGWIDKPSREHWQIGLRTGLTARSAMAAAAYEMTRFGQAAAAATHAPLIRPDARERPFVALIPFDWERIELHVEGLVLPAVMEGTRGLGRFLCLRVTQVRWPVPLHGFPARLEYRLDNNNTLHDPEGEPSCEPPVPHPALVPRVDDQGNTVVTTFEAPGRSAGRGATVPAPGPAFEGGPLVERMPLEPPAQPRKRRRTGTEEAGQSSTAEPQGGASDTAYIKHTGTGPEARSSLATMIEALNALEDRGTIVRWEPFLPQDAPYEYRDGVPVWLFPFMERAKKLKWSYLRPRGDDGFGASGPKRGCLVARIDLLGCMVYLMDAERRPVVEGGKAEGEHGAAGERSSVATEVDAKGITGKTGEAFSLLLFRAAEQDVPALVQVLLRHAAVKRGVWPERADDLEAEALAHVGDATLARRRHPRLAEGAPEAPDAYSERLGELLHAFGR